MKLSAFKSDMKDCILKHCIYIIFNKMKKINKREIRLNSESLWGVMETFYVLVVIAQSYAYVRTLQRVHLKLVNFIVFILYFNKCTFFIVYPLGNKRVMEIMLIKIYLLLAFGKLSSLRVPLCPSFKNMYTSNSFF